MYVVHTHLQRAAEGKKFETIQCIFLRVSEVWPACQSVVFKERWNGEDCKGTGHSSPMSSKQ